MSEPEVTSDAITPELVQPSQEGLVNIFEGGAIERTFTLEELGALGFIVPVADPQTLRSGFAFRQKMIAAILDPEHDFLYTFSYQERGQTIEKTTSSYSEVKKYVEMYKCQYKALPKISGVLKLATAFGIEARIIEQRGIPIEPNATYAYCRYEVKHPKTGRTEQGVGMASTNERRNPMPAHHCLALADTRAYSRAVRRLTGFGAVGAEEVGAPEAPEPMPRIIQGAVPKRLTQAVQREPFIGWDASQQEQEVVVSAVDPAKKANGAKASPTAVATQAPGQTATTQAPTTTTPAAASPQASPQPADIGIPMPTPGATTPVITDAQVIKLSKLAVAKLGTKDRAIEWLKTNAGVSSTREVREADYSKILSALEAMKEP